MTTKAIPLPVFLEGSGVHHPNPRDFRTPRRRIQALQRALSAAKRERDQAARQADDLREALRDETLRVREVDHRAKNSLQLAAAMLGLQARSLPDASAGRALTEAMRRLETLAAIHRALYEAGDGDRANIRVWLTRICDGLTLRPDIRVDLHCADVEWPAQTAAAVGLFINEAVSNALKHAFPSRSGNILVEVQPFCDGDAWRVAVTDDGDGYADVLREGLGYRLLRTFARQLGGEVAVCPGVDGRGLCVSMSFRIQ